jgi:hypothetical protein
VLSSFTRRRKRAGGVDQRVRKMMRGVRRVTMGWEGMAAVMRGMQA